MGAVEVNISQGMLRNALQSHSQVSSKALVVRWCLKGEERLGLTAISKKALDLRKQLKSISLVLEWTTPEKCV